MTPRLRRTVMLLSTAGLMIVAGLWLCGCGGSSAVGPTPDTSDTMQTKANTVTPTAGGGAGASANPTYDLTQTLSNQAQLNTIAFSGLAFLTGNLGADSFFPPGKVADWWGFQYLRDNDPSGLGHNTDFLTKAAFNMLNTLTAAQQAQLVSLAQSQVTSINSYAIQRFPLMKAFRRQLTGEIPAGSTGLSKPAVMSYSASLYKLDGQMSVQRAQVMGGIIHAFTPTQRTALDRLKGTGMATWPTLTEPAVLKGLSGDNKVAVMTYAGDMFSWYLGSLDADVYFCPERQGTYFGGFYLKDAPAMGNPDYTISNTLTGDMGAKMLTKLSVTQAKSITDLPPAQLAILRQIVTIRRSVATELRRAIAGQTINANTVLTLCQQYGRLDGELIYGDAAAFAKVGRSLTAQQRTDLAALRTELNVGVPTGAYRYSTPIAMPAIPNTDFLFGK